MRGKHTVAHHGIIAVSAEGGGPVHQSGIRNGIIQQHQLRASSERHRQKASLEGISSTLSQNQMAISKSEGRGQAGRTGWDRDAFQAGRSNQEQERRGERPPQLEGPPLPPTTSLKWPIVFLQQCYVGNNCFSLETQCLHV